MLRGSSIRTSRRVRVDDLTMRQRQRQQHGAAGPPLLGAPPVKVHLLAGRSQDDQGPWGRAGVRHGAAHHGAPALRRTFAHADRRASPVRCLRAARSSARPARARECRHPDRHAGADARHGDRLLHRRHECAGKWGRPACRRPHLADVRRARDAPPEALPRYHMGLPLRVSSGTGCTTSQCSTILSSSNLQKSANMRPRSFGPTDMK